MSLYKNQGFKSQAANESRGSASMAKLADRGPVDGRHPLGPSAVPVYIFLG